MQLTRHSRNAKHDDVFRRQQESWRHAYAQALSLRERFPRIEQLIVDMTFTDTRGFGTYSPRMHSFSPSAKAFFAIACPRTLCVDGGFDLDALVVKLLRNSMKSATGTLECAGHMRPGHAGQGPCMLQMSYRFEIRYALAARRG
jgi:hypothetical protein